MYFQEKKYVFIWKRKEKHFQGVQLLEFIRGVITKIACIFYSKRHYRNNKITFGIWMKWRWKLLQNAVRRCTIISCLFLWAIVVVETKALPPDGNTCYIQYKIVDDNLSHIIESATTQSWTTTAQQRHQIWKAWSIQTCHQIWIVTRIIDNN